MKQIEFLTSKLDEVMEDGSDPDVEQVQQVACLKNDQMRWQAQKLQAGLIISRPKGRFDTSRIKPAIQLKMASNTPLRAAYVEACYRALCESGG